MTFVIIFIISFFLVFYIYKKCIQRQKLKLQSPKLLVISSTLFVILTSSIIYYTIGSPFIDINKLNSSRLKIIESKKERERAHQFPYSPQTHTQR